MIDLSVIKVLVYFYIIWSDFDCQAGKICQNEAYNLIKNSLSLKNIEKHIRYFLYVSIFFIIQYISTKNSPFKTV